MASGLVGLVAGLVVPVPSPWLAAAGLACVGAAWAMRRRPEADACLHLAMAFAAFLHASLAAANPSERCLSRFVGDAPRFLAIDATIDEEPVALRRDDGSVRAWRAPAVVHGVRIDGGWRLASGGVDVRWVATDEAPRFGTRVVVEGVGVATDRGSVLRAHPGATVIVGRDGGSSFRAWCLRGRELSYRILGLGIEGFADEVGLLRALMLGYRQDLGDRVADAFSRTGTLHVVAISGSHLVMLAGIVVAVLRSMGLVRTRWILVLGPVLLVYTVATGFSSSAVRAFVMSMVFWFAATIRRRPDGGSALAAAAMAILAMDPVQVLNAGFQLSFVAVAGLITIHPLLLGWYRDRARDDAWAEPIPGIGAGPWPRRALMAFASLLAASIAAWVATTPITARVFNLVSPVGLVLNLLVIPWSGLILFTGCLSLLAGVVSTGAAEVFNHANRLFVTILFEVVEAFDRIPFGHVFVPTPPLLVVALLYACLLAFLVGRLRVRIASIACAVLVMAVPSIASLRRDAPTLQVAGLAGQPVGLLQSSAGAVLVGGAPATSRVEVERLLRRGGVDSLDAWVVPRPDASSFGSADRVLNRVGADVLLAPSAKRETPSFRSAAVMASGAACRVKRVHAGERLDLAGVGAEVVHPRAGLGGSVRDGAMAFRLTRGATSVLWLGYLDDELAGELAERGALVSASLVVVAAADPARPPSSAFWTACRARTVLVPPMADVAPSVRDAWREAMTAGGRELVVVEDGESVQIRFSSSTPRVGEPLFTLSRR